MESGRRFFSDPGSSYFLFGPRGTGKSTWVRERYPAAVYIDLLSADEFRRYSARPETLRETVLAQPGTDVVVIDEVQKAPAVLDVVHQLIEEKRGLRFVLTGSSARKLKRTGVDLLAGRALLRTLHPFMAAELGEAFDLERALGQGLLPLVVDSPKPADVLAAYAGLYVREEVQAEALVRRSGDFARFLEVVSFSHAQVLNASNVARECMVGRKTVQSYLEILEDLLLSFTLPVFARRAARATAVHPKLYLFDAGVYRSLRAAGPLDRPEEIAGAALEGLVAQHLRAWIAYGEDPPSLHYWRTRSGNEVDFVLYGPGTFHAIEVKSASTIQPAHFRGLRAFGQDYPEAKLLLLHRGRDALVRDGILCLPVERFLRELRPGSPIPGV